MGKIKLAIFGMHCVSCAKNIETALKRVPGISSVQVNFASENADVEFDPQKAGSREILRAVEGAGYKAVIADTGLDTQKALRDREVRGLKYKFIISICLSLVLMYISMGHHFDLPYPKFLVNNNALFQLLLASAVVFCGGDFSRGGYLSLIRHHRANMDVLISLGVGSAYLYSLYVSISFWMGNKSFGMDKLYYEVAAFLLSFILLGKYLEAITKRTAGEALKSLWNLRPKTAIVIRGDQEKEIPIEEISVGDVVLIKPGSRIPVDGEVVWGYSSVDESLVTGESLPQEKNIRAKVIAGSINKSGVFRFKATRVGEDTTLYQIIKLVESAQASKAPVQELADKVSAVFVPGVLIVAFSSFFIWILAGQAFVFALTVFITVLIIACPCALGLATPTAVMVASGIAAKGGIIIKNAAALQAARDIKVVIFDKTGTLTLGKPKITDIVNYTGSSDELLKLAALIEKGSEHILADAFVNEAAALGLSLDNVVDFESVPGQGVKGKIAGREVFLGNIRLIQEEKIKFSATAGDLERLEAEGKTVMFLSVDKKLQGLFAARDMLKEFAGEVIVRLKKDGRQVFMITGDNRRTAQAIAKELGIDKIISEVLPAGKLEEIRKLQEQGSKVAFVGDGINDAPALTQADLGIAIGSGTDVAVESGDIILIKDDLRDIVFALELSAYAMRKIKQNLFFSFFYNILGIPIAAGILYPVFGFLLNPVIAGAAMAFSSVSVVANSLLMHRFGRRFKKDLCGVA